MSACLGEMFSYGWLKMKCLYVSGTMNECLLRRDVQLWMVKNVVLVCVWDHE